VTTLGLTPPWRMWNEQRRGLVKARKAKRTLINVKFTGACRREVISVRSSARPKGSPPEKL